MTRPRRIAAARPAPVGTTRDLLDRMRHLERLAGGDMTTGTADGGRAAHYERLEELRAIRAVLRTRAVGGLYVTADM